MTRSTGLKARGRGRPPKPVTIRGVTYESQSAAAEIIGVTQPAISRALKSGSLNCVGMSPKVPVTIRGVEYESQAAAARALGVSRQVVSMAKRQGTLDNVGLSKARGAT